MEIRVRLVIASAIIYPNKTSGIANAEVEQGSKQIIRNRPKCADRGFAE
jgi:hypothetical protein